MQLEPADWQGKAPVRLHCAAVIDGVIVGAGSEGLLCSWDAETGAPLRQTILRSGAKHFIGSTLWGLADGRLAVLQSKPGVLLILSSQLSEVARHDVAGILWYADVHEGGDLVVARAEENRVVLVDVHSGQIVTSYTPRAKVSALGIQGDTVAIGLADGGVQFFQVRR
jgi:hypothetical protein